MAGARGVRPGGKGHAVRPVSGSLEGRVALVTGANSGVGRSATEMLLAAGARVTMVCRSRARGDRALAEMRDRGLGREPAVGDATVRAVVERADLSRQADVRELAARLVARLPAIDILVNNAGVSQSRCVPSAEGFELTFATNHLGHFLLTRLLRDRLRAGRGRIVNVSSRGHRGGDLRRASLEDIARGRAWKGGLQAYADSKLANVLFTMETTRRWGGRGITANAVHPGVLATDIWRKTPPAVRLLVRPLTWFMASPDVGGEAVMNLVADPTRDHVTGRYFHVLEERLPSAQARDEALARELWERSVEWTRAASPSAPALPEDDAGDGGRPRTAPGEAAR